MFASEYVYRKARRRAIADGRQCIQADGSKQQWPVTRQADRNPRVYGRGVFAQNDAYLELCNPGWDLQWKASGMLILFGLLPLFLYWTFYGFAIHPVFSGHFIFLLSTFEADSSTLWFGWLFLFPLSLLFGFAQWLMLEAGAGKTGFFTYARGRIRFNRLTRKVYVLRPKNCGGDAVFDWDRLRAILDADGYDYLLKRNAKPGQAAYHVLVLYHPPFDEADPQAEGEDALFVGPTLGIADVAPPLWEYIRRYMEYGPGQKGIPEQAELADSIYCGKPSGAQYRLECNEGYMGTLYHMLSQVTCSWPKFPKEWESDSGIGEPEDKPVQAGAVMTALVYRAKGKLSKADEVELMRLWGTEEGLAAAMARSDD